MPFKLEWEDTVYETIDGLINKLRVDYKVSHNAVYRFLRGNRGSFEYELHEFKSKIECAIQRLQRGYDDAALWNLDYFIADKVGTILVRLAKEGNSWPGPPVVNSYEEWTAQLEKAGNALLAFKKDDGDEKVYESAKEAMHWLADNFGTLWD